MRQVIPVFHCFDRNYCIPAAVAFHSMLTHASKEYDYALYVVHDDIPPHMQDRLVQSIREFPNARLEFITAPYAFADLFSRSGNKGHFSKEIFHKFIVADLFPQYDKMIVSDVDVVYAGDVSISFESLDVAEDIYLGGCTGLVRRGSYADEWTGYFKAFTDEECKKIMVGAGYMVYNLRLMREAGIVRQFIEYAEANAPRLIQPEQDVINLVCHPKMKYLPVNTMVCTYSYDFYLTESDYAEDVFYSAEEVAFALKNPIQVHYAGGAKPWIFPGCHWSLPWYQHLFKTPLAADFLPVMHEHFVRK